MAWTKTRTLSVGGWTFTLVLDAPFPAQLVIETPPTKQQGRLRFELSPEDTTAWLHQWDEGALIAASHQRQCDIQRLAAQWVRQAPPEVDPLKIWIRSLDAHYHVATSAIQKQFTDALNQVLRQTRDRSDAWRTVWQELQKEWTTP